VEPDPSVAEIADQCGTSAGTVRVWLHRGRAGDQIAVEIPAVPLA